MRGLTKRIIGIILLFTMTFGLVTTIKATDTSVHTSGEWQYYIVDGGVEIVNYLGTQNNINIPDSIDGKSVVSIYSYENKEDKINSIYIPSSVININFLCFLF